VTVPEAALEDSGSGLKATSDGWFVLNLDSAAAFRNPKAGVYFPLEDRGRPSADFGLNVHVLWPGQPNCLYHSESVREAFLVLSGECVLLVEEEQRRLRPWDFFHCPAGTAHVFVGAGDGPCAILMVGARTPGATVHYPVSDVAAAHGASAGRATDSPSEAYADWPRTELSPQRVPWPPEG
jgi:uncharacterized cupin superfamily protein